MSSAESFILPIMLGIKSSINFTEAFINWLLSQGIQNKIFKKVANLLLQNCSTILLSIHVSPLLSKSFLFSSTKKYLKVEFPIKWS